MGENFDPPTENEILRLAGIVRSGADYWLACRAIGIPRPQAEQWQEKAQAAEASQAPGVYLDLFKALDEASAQAEVIALQRVLTEGGASGAKWLLEKLYPGKYGNRAPRPTGPRRKQIAAPAPEITSQENEADPGPDSADFEDVQEIDWDELE